MEKGAIKDLVYGGLQEILNNSRYYYHSSVSVEYSKFTEAGEQAVMEFMQIMSFKMKQAEQADLTRRAKEQVMKNLKGE